MKRVIIIQLCAALMFAFVSCSNDKDNPLNGGQTLNELAGAWNGYESSAGTWTLTFTNTEFQLRKADSTEWYTGRYTYNNAISPSQVNLYIDNSSIAGYIGKSSLGIYQIVYTNLTVMLSQPGNTARPENFNSTGSRKFELSSLVPPIVQLVSPENKAIDADIFGALTWTNNPGTLKYELQVAKDSLFPVPLTLDTILFASSFNFKNFQFTSTYFWRVRGINSRGNSTWSSVRRFTTLTAGVPCVGLPTVTYEGKTYNTVQIGSRCWLKENLNVGVMLDSTKDETNNQIIEKRCYDDKPENCDKYGGWYMLYEALNYSHSTGDVRGICPEGWHIPNQIEFKELNRIVNGDANKLKAVGEGTGAGAGTNETGFSALLAGTNSWKHSYLLKEAGYILGSTTDAQQVDYGLLLAADTSSVRLVLNYYYGCFNVRCVKD